MQVTHNFSDINILAKNNEKLRKDLPHMIETQVILAEYNFARYNALIQAGFSKDDALWLIK